MRLSFLLQILFLAAAVAFNESLGGYNPTEAMNGWQLTNAAYCDSSSIQSWSCPNCKRSTYVLSDVVISSAGGSMCFTGYDAKQNVIIASFRGSENIANWINNIDTVKTTYPYCPSGCKVHAGFYKAYLNIVASFRNAVKGLMSKTKKIRIYGHSLGGAEAVHAAADLAQNQPELTIDYVYTFGQPRVGDNDFWRWYGSKVSNHFRATHGHDIVPHLPPMNLGFHHINLEEFYAQDPPNFKQCDTSGEDPTCSNQYTVSLSIKDHLTYMGGTCCCTSDDQTIKEPMAPVEPEPVVNITRDDSVCSGANTCDRCIALKVAGVPACTWCTYQAACHDVGSIYNPCPNDGCVTRSPVSTCKLRNCTQMD